MTNRHSLSDRHARSERAAPLAAPRRRADGSLDVAHYEDRARDLRASAFSRLFRTRRPAAAEKPRPAAAPMR